jgi:hypothetical protein
MQDRPAAWDSGGSRRDNFTTLSQPRKGHNKRHRELVFFWMPLKSKGLLQMRPPKI